MGLVFDEKKEAAVQEPAVGAHQVQILTDCIAEAMKISDLSVRHALIDGINNRYRSFAYRDAVKLWVKEGHMNLKQQAEMAQQLAVIRRNPRTPSAKAFRNQWP